MNKNNELHAYVRCNENALFYWVMQYSNNVKVINPPSFVEKVKEGLKIALEKYQ